MKRKAVAGMMALLLTASSVFAADRDGQGNGRIVTKNISISEYTEISLLGSIQFEYTQSNEAPKLELTIDENLVDDLDIQVKGGKLSIYPNNQGRNFSPTVYRVRSNSRTLEGCELAGSGSFTVVSPLKVDRVELELAGSGDIHLPHRTSGYKLEMSLAGSGDIRIDQADLEALEASVAGSGDAWLKGKVKSAEYNVAGSGEIHAFDCDVDRADCSVAGGGVISVKAVSRLDASTAGSGEIIYRGNPVVSSSKYGSGSIRKE